jgi:hypothetical protein
MVPPVASASSTSSSVPRPLATVRRAAPIQTPTATPSLAFIRSNPYRANTTKRKAWTTSGESCHHRTDARAGSRRHREGALWQYWDGAETVAPSPPASDPLVKSRPALLLLLPPPPPVPPGVMYGFPKPDAAGVADE